MLWTASSNKVLGYLKVAFFVDRKIITYLMTTGDLLDMLRI